MGVVRVEVDGGSLSGGGWCQLEGKVMVRIRVEMDGGSQSGGGWCQLEVSVMGVVTVEWRWMAGVGVEVNGGSKSGQWIRVGGDGSGRGVGGWFEVRGD